MFDTMLGLGRLRITILCKETIPTVNGNVDKMKP